MKIIVATGNLHKVEEIEALLKASSLEVEVVSAKSVGGMPDVEETGVTFAENAEIKARALFEQLDTPAWVLADDSGLCVEALKGAPGVYSARYAGVGASDKENLEKLLNEIHNVKDNDRQAHFVCDLALIAPDGSCNHFEGICRGMLLREPVGGGGFGYDPIFVPMGYAMTFSQLLPEVKNGISHRGRAFQRLIEWVKSATAS